MKAGRMINNGMIALLIASTLAPATAEDTIKVDTAIQELETSIISNNPNALLANTLTTNNVELDLAVPVSPAFTVLDITPESVIRPTRPKEFATELLNGVDPNGNFQTGLAFDTAPYLLLTGDELTLADYSNYPTRLASRTQFSLATTKGSSEDDESLRLALGLRVTPFDLGDPRTGKVNDPNTLLGCHYDVLKGVHDETNKLVQEVFAPAKATGRTDLTVEEATRYRNQLEENRKVPSRLDGCRDKFRVQDWNASSWSLGVAPTWTSPDGSTEDLEWSGVALWSSFAYGFDKIQGLQDNAQAIFHARYRSDDLVPDPNEEENFREQDTFVLGLQTRIAGPNQILSRDFLGGPDLSFLLDLSYTSADIDGEDNEDVFRYAVGVESQISCGLYFKISLGSENGSDDDQAFVLGSFNLGFSEQPSLNFIPKGSKACDQ